MSEMSSRDLLERLIGFATVSRDSNLELIEFIRDYLAQLGVESELFYNAERTKANLFATIGPRDRGGIVLSGHTDVVPVDGQAWTVDPFRLTEKDGRLYGRGTADMKGFIASVLAAVPAVSRARAEDAGASRVLLRRGSRMPRRAADARGTGEACAQAGAVPDRRADRIETGARPQGQARDALSGERRAVPFRLRAVWRQRHSICGAADQSSGRDRRAAGAARASRRAFRSAVSRPCRRA